MGDLNGNVGSWAIETNNLNERHYKSTDYGSSPRIGTYDNAQDDRDLRCRLRRSRGEKESEDASSSRKDNRFHNNGHSPLVSPTHPRRSRTEQACSSSRSNYRREKNGLSPLRSPLNSDQRLSRVNPSYRRRANRRDPETKKENEVPKSSSASKRNSYSSTTANPKPSLSMDVEEQKFRRRLDLPTERESSKEEDGCLNYEVEEDRITIRRREKQIAYGKNSESYRLYIAAVPKDQRSVDRKKHPRTPIKTSQCSRRNWDAQIKAWKKYTHQWANINCPTMCSGSRSSEAESDSQSLTTRDRAEMKEEAADNNTDLDKEEDNGIDLNAEEDDESFLEGFELDYELS